MSPTRHKCPRVAHLNIAKEPYKYLLLALGLLELQVALCPQSKRRQHTPRIEVVSTQLQQQELETISYRQIRLFCIGTRSAITLQRTLCIDRSEGGARKQHCSLGRGSRTEPVQMGCLQHFERLSPPGYHCRGKGDRRKKRKGCEQQRCRSLLLA